MTREFQVLLIECERILREIGYSPTAGSLGPMTLKKLQAAIKGAKALDTMASKRLAGMDEHQFYDEFLEIVKTTNTITRGAM